MVKRHFTSESVNPGHPDKLCDQISDGILDTLLLQDPHSRVAVETLATTGLILAAGEVTTKGYVDVQNTIRRIVRKVGYDDPKWGFDADQCSVLVSLHGQSPYISQGVTEAAGREQGAGDQGLMFGYATNETPAFMPLPIWLAKQISKKQVEVRENGTLPYLGPDGKCQVTVEYDNGKPKRVSAVVVSNQHLADAPLTLRKDIRTHIIDPVCADWVDAGTVYYTNPTGAFVQGGPGADSGVTGRKIIVDTYGGWARHGGGAFSGKDPTKVDRSAALAARHVAKNIVAAGLAGRCEVQIAYAIGIAQPVSLLVDTQGTGRVSDDLIAKAVSEVFDLRPKSIIERLDLRRPIYEKTAALGPFGWDGPDFTWERTDKVRDLCDRLNFAKPA